MVEHTPQWKPYDSSWLIKLAIEQHPEKKWLPEALAVCNKGYQESNAYTYFVRKSEWQFETNIALYSPTKGLIILDVLEQKRIGGVEITFEIGPKLTCNCGYVFDYKTQSANWLAIRNDHYNELREIELEIAKFDEDVDKSVKRTLTRKKEV